MKNPTRQFCIKERQNPQLGTYFVQMGWLSQKEIKACEKAIYGRNIVHSFKTEAEGLKFLQEQEAEGSKTY